MSVGYVTSSCIHSKVNKSCTRDQYSFSPKGGKESPNRQSLTPGCSTGNLGIVHLLLRSKSLLSPLIFSYYTVINLQ